MEDHAPLVGPTKSRSLTATWNLPLYPPVKAAEFAIRSILEREFHVCGDEARRRVRVEITREVEQEIRSLVSASDPYLIHDPKQIGPMQIMGVSYYVVDRLPEPGWRVLP